MHLLHLVLAQQTQIYSTFNSRHLTHTTFSRFRRILDYDLSKDCSSGVSWTRPRRLKQTRSFWDPRATRTGWTGSSRGDTSRLR